MASEAIKVEIDSTAVQAALARLTDHLEDLTPLFEDIGTLIESKVHQRFDTKTGPDRAPWEPWAPSTASQRAKEGRGTLLEYTGQIRDSLTFVAFPDRVEIGFGVDYAGVHEFGSEKSNIPSRHMLLATDGESLGDQDLADVLNLIEEYLRD